MSDAENAPQNPDQANHDHTDPDAPRKKRRRRRRGGRGKRSGEEGSQAEPAAEAADGQQRTGDPDRDEAIERTGGGRGKRRRRGGKGRGRDGDVADNAGDGDHSEQPAPDVTPRPRRVSQPFDPSEPNDLFAEKTFADLGLRNSVLKGLDAMGFKHPTVIQDQLIPHVLAGKDVLGQAKTGSGKTAAFGLPLFHRATRELPFQTLILVPTRELAIQVARELSEMGAHTPIRVCAVYGGDSVRQQADDLAKGPEIIVATPGRLMDMVERRHLHFDNVRFIVLDEVDRMLDIGFRDDIRRILKSINTDHQTVFVSATISEEIEKLGRTFMKPDAEKIVAAAGSLTVSLVEQHYLAVEPWDKKRLLQHLLSHEEPDLTIVFCRTKATVDVLSRYLRDKGIEDVRAIHGDMRQQQRNQVMQSLRKGSLSVLIASDLAARGLDVDDISHVINYDLPEDPEVYIHRIGRTARAGRRGVAWSFVSTDQGHLLTQIEKLANVHIPHMEYPDFKPGPLPDNVRAERERREKVLSAPAKSTRLAAGGSAVPRDADPSKFPGGLVPAKLPPRTLGGRVRTSRSRPRPPAPDTPSDS